jgi:hypothetical protein
MFVELLLYVSTSYIFVPLSLSCLALRICTFTYYIQDIIWIEIRTLRPSEPISANKVAFNTEKLPAYIRWMINDKSWQSFSLAKRFIFSPPFLIVCNVWSSGAGVLVRKTIRNKKKPRKCWSSSYISYCPFIIFFLRQSIMSLSWAQKNKIKIK